MVPWPPTAFPSLLETITLVFRCGLSDTARPGPSAVREARHVIFTQVQAASLETYLAKVAVLHDGCKHFQEASRSHAVGGLNDEATTLVYGAGSIEYETQFPMASDDVDVYFVGSESTPPLSTTRLCGRWGVLHTTMRNHFVGG